VGHHSCSRRVKPLSGNPWNVSFDLLREHGLRLNPNLTMAIKALTQAEAITSLLYPEEHFLRGGRTGAGIAAAGGHRRSGDRRRQEQVMTVAREVVNRIPSLSTLR